MRYLSSLSVLSLFAASTFALQIGVGLDVGMQRAWVDRWAIETPLAGVNVPVFFTDEQGLQLSVRYSPKGWENDSGYRFATEMLHYIDIPVKYCYYPAFLPVKLGVSVGINYSILMAATLAEYEPYDNFKDYYTATDYGLLFGFHLKKPLAIGSLLFSLEYYAGLQTIRDTWPLGPIEYETRPVKNHAFSACIGYDFTVLTLGGGPLKKAPVKE